MYTDEWSLLTAEQKNRITENKQKVEKAKNKIGCKNIIFWYLSNFMFLLSICAFIIGIIFMGIVFFQLSINL